MFTFITRKHWIILYIATLFVAILLGIEILRIHTQTKVAVLDIGQGDAILIQTPEGKNILIDAGPGSAIAERLGEQMGFFDKTIDLFILTHPHLDHFGGLLEVSKNYTVKQVLLTGIASDSPLYPGLIRSLQEKKVPIDFARQDIDWHIGQSLYLDLLYPLQNQSLIGQKATNLNNSSVVARLVQNTPSGMEVLMMLPGDTEKEEEREILLSGQAVQSPILKAGHHGSRTSTSKPFFEAVQAKKVVISAGKDNKFGHPHPETLEKIKDLEYWITARDGTVVFWF